MIKQKTFYIAIALFLTIVCMIFLFIYNFNKKFSVNEENIREEIDITNVRYKYKNDSEKKVVVENYISQKIEDQFLNEENIVAATALVSCDEMLEQFSLELELQSNGEISEDQIEIYKNLLQKNFYEVILIINGEEK